MRLLSSIQNSRQPCSRCGRSSTALGQRAWEADRQAYPSTFPFFQFLRGLAENRLGRLGPAIDLMQGDASGVFGPAPRLVLAMALNGDGRVDEARRTLTAALNEYDWRASEVRDQDGWIYHSLRREAERRILQDSPTDRTPSSPSPSTK